jgi:hypothetical protein
MGMSGRNIQRVKTETDQKVTEQACDFIYLRNRFSKLKKKTHQVTNIQHNKIYYITKRNVGTQMSIDKKLHFNNVTKREKFMRVKSGS